jgi:hypothetical protein
MSYGRILKEIKTFEMTEGFYFCMFVTGLIRLNTGKDDGDVI